MPICFISAERLAAEIIRKESASADSFGKGENPVVCTVMSLINKGVTGRYVKTPTFWEKGEGLENESLYCFVVRCSGLLAMTLFSAVGCKLLAVSYRLIS